MNKKFLALALASAVMLMGAGYAQWTDQLKANNTIKTGELSVHFVDNSGPSSTKQWIGVWDATKNNAPLSEAESLVKARSTFGDKTMTFTVDNMYPGIQIQTKDTIINDGTIDTAVQKVTVDVTTPNLGPDNVASVADQILVEGYITIKDSTNTINRYAPISFTNVKLADLQQTLNDALHGKVLKPGDVIVLGDGDQSGQLFKYTLPLNSLTGDLGEKETVNVNFTYDFVQGNGVDK